MRNVCEKFMATIKTLIKKNERRIDGTWNVLVRITHNRKSVYIRTSLFVSKSDLTSSFKIKNARIIDKCREIENDLRLKLSALNLEMTELDITQIVNYLEKTKTNNSIDFIAFCRKWAERHTNLKGLKNYISAINSFISMFGRERIFCDEITSKTLKQFEQYLIDKKRAQSMYPSAILKLFNEAKEFYNDDDIGIFKIKHSIKYKPKKQNIAEKRSLPENIIRSIYSLPYNNIKIKGYESRRDLAKDCYILSFCLMGINSVDLFNAKEYDGEYITYYRTKTTDRRENDKAKMVVRIHPFIKPIFDKYYKGGRYVFNFHDRFSDEKQLNRAINLGLKEIAKELQLDNFQFYSARHSFATIAVNKVLINKYIVNDMLCHVDKSMKVTELYIEKDYSVINDANFKLIEYVFLKD